MTVSGTSILNLLSHHQWRYPHQLESEFGNDTFNLIQKQQLGFVNYLINREQFNEASLLIVDLLNDSKAEKNISTEQLLKELC